MPVSKRTSATRVVYAQMTTPTGYESKRLIINRRGPIMAQVLDQLNPDEAKRTFGVLDSTKTTWID